MLIKGKFKIKDNLMEKKHDLGLSHSKCRLRDYSIQTGSKILSYAPCFQKKPKGVF